MERFFQGVEGKRLKVIQSLFSLSLSFCLCITCVFCFLVLNQSSFMLFFALFNTFLFVCFKFCFILCFIKIIKKLKNQKNTKNSVCFVYIGTCVLLMAIETNFSKLCIFCSLDKHLYAQLSKWALWLVFVMSKVK